MASPRVPVAAPPRVSFAWQAVVAVVAIGLYVNSLGGAFVYDDLNAISGNALVVTGDVQGILTTPSWWGDGRGTLWRPLTTLSFALDHAMFGLAPFGYHAANVGWHALVSVLVLVVFAAVGVGTPVALGAALLFASHPVHSEAVANVVGRAELIAAAGFFLAWRAWIAADRTDGAGTTTWTAVATLVFFLAMLAKENVIALPAVLFVVDLLKRRGEAPTALRRRRAARYGALLLAAVVFVALRHAVVGQLTPTAALLDNPLGVLPLVPRLLTAVAVVGLYALRLVAPFRLSADYSYDQIPAVHSPADPGFLAGLAVIVGIVGLGWWARRRLPALAVGLAVLALTFALVSNLLFPIGTIMGERLLYLPSAGFCLAVAAGLAAAGRGWVFVPVVTAIVGLYGARTVTRNPVWREPLGFFQAMTVDAPRSARAHAELASALAEAGRIDEAGRAFERALAIKPEDAGFLYNWGHALAHAGRFDAAAALYRRAIAAKPDFGRAYENLGGVESARGDQQAALTALRRARELTPESPHLLMTIANVLVRAGSNAEARAVYEQALAERPDDPLILTSYGVFLQGEGEDRSAVEILERIPPPLSAEAAAALTTSRRRVHRDVR